MVSLLIEFNFNFCHLKNIKGSEISDLVYVLTTQDVKKNYCYDYIILSIGIKYSGSCSVKKYNKKGKMIDNNDITGLMQAEGGVLCATVLFVLMVRLLILRDNRRTQRKLKIDLEGQKKCGGYLFFIGMGLYIANFGLCIGGGQIISHNILWVILND